MELQELPLFPLHTVLFPGERLDLRVFETRYFDMVRSCLRDEIRFGVVAIRRGSEVGHAEPFMVGTTARVVDWSAEAPGVLGISVLGMQRFRCGAIRQEADGLYLATDVVMLDDEPEPVRSQHRWAMQVLAGLPPAEDGADGRGPAHEEARTALDDANRVCWNLVRLLPLSLADRQELLELNQLDARLAWLQAKAESL